MALRNILNYADQAEALRKKSRKVEKIDQRMEILLADMRETLAANNGAGLAAPQVGVLRRIAVVDAGDGEGVLELINPEILEKEGSEERVEGCLSFPGQFGYVDRPTYVKVKTHDHEMNEVIIEAYGLKAQACCHEIEHLDGKLFIDQVNRMLTQEELIELQKAQRVEEEEAEETTPDTLAE